MKPLDLLTDMEEELGMRQFGSVICSKSIRPCLTLCARY